MTLKPVGFLVVGLGRIGRLHAELLRYRVENAKLVAVCDVIESLARDVATKLGVKYYTNLDDALRDKDVDAVVIATPTHLHKDMCIKALEAGKHVFVEKPLAPNLRDAKEIARYVEKTKLKFMVGYMRRFDRYYARAQQIVRSGELGKVIAFLSIARDPQPPPGWASDPKLSGGIFLDQLSHDFDIARWIVGEVREVYVVGGNYISEEIKARGDLDVVSILLRFENGAQGFIHGARRNAFGYDLRTEVYCEHGTVFIGNPVDNLSAVGTEKGITFEGIPWFEKRFYEAYINELRDFVDSIVKDREPGITVNDGVKAVEIAEACWKSFRSGKPIELS